MEYLFVLKGTDLDVAQKSTQFHAGTGGAIAVAEAQNYPPSLDPSKVNAEKIKKMPAFDPTGKLEGYLFADPAYWNAHQVEWTEKWDRSRRAVNPS
jgi:spermidine/putrescine transport system substrate-binding protein